MTRAEVVSLFSSLRLWARGERAPREPLRLVSAPGRRGCGEPREMSFSEVDREVGRLLREFGSPRQSGHADYPLRRQGDHLREPERWVG